MYLGTIVGGLFAELGSRGSLIVRGDATATATSILANQPLFRAGLVADLVMLACYIGVTALFHVMFAPVSRRVSLMAAIFSVIGIAVLAVDSFFLVATLRLLVPQPYLASVLDVPQREAMALLSLKLHGDGYDFSLVFFGVYCLMLGWLVWRSSFIPKIIGGLMALAGICYLINSVADLALPAFARSLSPHIMDPTLIGEAALGIWLLIFGTNGWPRIHRADR
ncbi:MAG: DUF4386 domain-containing protein [Candidatus Sphingomonas colombiensis]|nr:DUF4386 domain-containing protein [Sphingomonas sp.]WEK43198.1 MAG: DUF4386 domain-containing protein [Sphingomonas sp.]